MNASLMRLNFKAIIEKASEVGGSEVGGSEVGGSSWFGEIVVSRKPVPSSTDVTRTTIMASLGIATLALFVNYLYH